MNNIENKGMLGGWVKDENGFLQLQNQFKISLHQNMVNLLKP